MIDKRVAILLLGLGLVVIIAVGVLARTRLAQSDSPAAVPFQQETTARAAFSLAADRAAQWRDDAALAVVSGQQSGREITDGESIEWMFQFFSPAAGQLALVAVSEGEARLLHEKMSPYRIPTLSERDWRVDSDQALETWWEDGGGFLVRRRPSVQVAMQLRVARGASDGEAIWTIVGVDFDQESTFTVDLDAATGARVGE